MIPPRLIPVLLIDRRRRVVKTVKFGNRTYIGDPFNIIRLFNEKEVDEICVLDIDASKDGRDPDIEFAAALASECFMPLSYGGGIRTVEQARQLIAHGIEKVVLCTHATTRLISTIRDEFGAQAVVCCLNYIDEGDLRMVGITREPLAAAAARLAAAGAGELILQSIERDGTRAGMDLEGIATTAADLPIPVIGLGGAGQVNNLYEALSAGADAAASGSAFCFIGPLRAVLVTYPEYVDRQKAASA